MPDGHFTCLGSAVIEFPPRPGTLTSDPIRRFAKLHLKRLFRPNRILSIQQIMRDRALAIVACGFTERQARFFITVMLHSDVFVERPYCAFANIAHGQKTTDFLRKLVDGTFATAIATGRFTADGSSTCTTSRCTRPDLPRAGCAAAARFARMRATAVALLHTWRSRQWPF
jgi:hypothetical protein